MEARKGRSNHSRFAGPGTVPGVDGPSPTATAHCNGYGDSTPTATATATATFTPTPTPTATYTPTPYSNCDLYRPRHHRDSYGYCDFQHLRRKNHRRRLLQLSYTTATVARTPTRSYAYGDADTNPHSDTRSHACGPTGTKGNQCDCQQLYRELEQRKRCDRLSVDVSQASLLPLTYSLIRIWTSETRPATT